MALWVRHWDEASAHEYFVHTETGESRWEPPDEFEAAPAPDHAPASPLNAPAAAGGDDDDDYDDYDAPRGYDPPTSRSSAAVALFRQATSPDDASDDASDVAPGSLAMAAMVRKQPRKVSRSDAHGSGLRECFLTPYGCPKGAKKLPASDLKQRRAERRARAERVAAASASAAAKQRMASTPE